MKLNHLNLPVPDVAAARQLFETYFDFRPDSAAPASAGLAVLYGADNFVLVLMRLGAAEAGAYPKAFHTGFICETSEQVRAKYEELRAGGIDMLHEPRELRGSLVFYFQALGGLLFEVSCPL